MGEDLAHIVRGGTVRLIAPVKEVLVLQKPNQRLDHLSVYGAAAGRGEDVVCPCPAAMRAVFS
jgi:hypothetical protein